MMVQAETDIGDIVHDGVVVVLNETEDGNMK
jgi:hypothetical protein